MFETKDGKLGVVWMTTWDTEDDARDFARQYTRFQTTKMGEGVESPEVFPDVIRRPHDRDRLRRRAPRARTSPWSKVSCSETTEKLVNRPSRPRKKELEPIKRK